MSLTENYEKIYNNLISLCELSVSTEIKNVHLQSAEAAIFISLTEPAGNTEFFILKDYFLIVNNGLHEIRDVY